jgi:hypothetical protein
MILSKDTNPTPKAKQQKQTPMEIEDLYGFSASVKALG